ncbi:MAG: hypothetical protein PF637_09490 [Spirochaetes bacterium]|nr:hypothetical protein [Spirochaetota bacterium]
MKIRTYYITVISVLLIIAPLSAGTMVVTEGTYTPFSTTTINRQVHELADDINNEAIIKLSGNQENLAQSTSKANSSLILQGNLITANDAPTASGSISTAIATENPFDLSNFASNIEDGKDRSTSVSPGSIVATVSISGSALPISQLQNWIFDIKCGGFAMDNLSGRELNYDSFILGVGTRYKFYNFTLTNENFQLRSLSIGTGLYYTRNNIFFTPDDIDKESDESNGYLTRSTSEVELTIQSSNYTIPLDITSSAKVFNHFNIMAGTGLDLCFGSTKIDVKTDTTVNAYDSNDNLIETDNPATMELTDSKTEGSAPVARFKAIFGFGLSFGPVHIAMPIAIYPTNGYTAALIVGGEF